MAKLAHTRRSSGRNRDPSIRTLGAPPGSIRVEGATPAPLAAAAGTLTGAAMASNTKNNVGLVVRDDFYEVPCLSGSMPRGRELAIASPSDRRTRGPALRREQGEEGVGRLLLTPATLATAPHIVSLARVYNGLREHAGDAGDDARASRIGSRSTGASAPER